MMQLVSRSEATVRGLDRYSPGSTCKHGHIAERITRNGECTECDRVPTSFPFPKAGCMRNATSSAHAIAATCEKETGLNDLRR